MKFSKRFKLKYAEFIDKFTDKNIRVVWLAWQDVINSEEFNQEDLIETLDYLVDIFREKEILTFDPSTAIFSSDKFDSMMYDLEEKKVNDYQDFFLKRNNRYSLNTIMESIVKHYGDLLDWNKIFTNTLMNDFDDSKINNRGIELIEAYHELMFSEEIENATYVPASGTLFLKCLELGISIPYNYLREAIFEKNTTFANHLFDLFMTMFSDDMDINTTPFLTFADEENEEEEIEICVYNLFVRVSYDDEMINFIEKVKRAAASADDETEDDDFGDELGF